MFQNTVQPSMSFGDPGIVALLAQKDCKGLQKLLRLGKDWGEGNMETVVTITRSTSEEIMDLLMDRWKEVF